MDTYPQGMFSMDAKLALCTLLLLILLGSHHTNGSMATGFIEQVHSHSSSHMRHMDQSLIVFFLIEDLKQGNTIPIHFPKRKLSDAYLHLLPKHESDSIPFSSEKLHYLLRFFSLPEKSPQAIAMEDTLRQCEAEHIDGERKLCATSYESMIGFAKTILGSETEIKILSTTHFTPSDDVRLQRYTVMGIREIKARKMVACHTMPYPYAVFYCHYQESGNRVYWVSLVGENGDKVEAVAVCHVDTSHWSRDHVSFRVLGIEPGSSPVCHFFPADSFVLVPSATLDAGIKE